MTNVKELMAQSRGSREFDALRLSPEDNVATVLRTTVEAGDRLRVKCGDATFEVAASGAVPFCHKISLSEIPLDAKVLKYGHSIGLASAQIAAGAHVHVHNLQSARAKAADHRTKTAPDPRAFQQSQSG